MTHISSTSAPTSPASLMCPVMWDFLSVSVRQPQARVTLLGLMLSCEGRGAEQKPSPLFSCLLFLVSAAEGCSALRSWLMPIWMYWLIVWSNYGLPSRGGQDTGRQCQSIMLWLRPSHRLRSNQRPPPDSDPSPFHTPRKPISPKLVHLNVKCISRQWALSALNQDICFSPS